MIAILHSFVGSAAILWLQSAIGDNNVSVGIACAALATPSPPIRTIPRHIDPISTSSWNVATLYTKTCAI